MPNKPAVASSAKSSRFSLFIGWGFGIVAVLLLFVFSIANYGMVSGEEFSPDTFHRRNYSYYEIPFFRIQIWSITRNDITGPLEKDLLKKKIVKPINRSKPRWDLVYESHGQTVLPKGDAALLANYLDESSNKYWLEWTSKHPKIGNLLWPVVVDLSRQQLYFFIPELIELASNATDPDEFQQALNALLGENYSLLAESQQQQDAHQIVVELTDAGLKYAPANEALLHLRETSLKALGKPGGAKAEPRDAKKPASNHS